MADEDEQQPARSYPDPRREGTLRRSSKASMTRPPRPPPAAEAAKPKPTAESWEAKKLKERVAKLTAKNKELEARAAAPPVVPGADEAAKRQEDDRVERRAREAGQPAAIQRTDAAGSSSPGERTFRTFSKRSNPSAPPCFDPTDPAANARYAGLVNGILETADDDPKVLAKLIHLIGSDPEVAERLAGLSPVRLGKELAKMAEQPPVEPDCGRRSPPRSWWAAAPPSHVAIDPGDATRADRLSMTGMDGKAERPDRGEPEVRTENAIGRVAP